MLTCKQGFAYGLKIYDQTQTKPRRKKMKFQKKMIVLTTAAVATFGLIACGAAVADSKKDDEVAVKPMAMKSTPAKVGMKGGCSHGAKGKMGGPRIRRKTSERGQIFRFRDLCGGFSLQFPFQSVESLELS